jgi:rod shape determining protein RodA
MMSSGPVIRSGSSLLSRARFMPWGLMVLLCVLGGIGFAALYSAGGGHVDPWAMRQGTRFIAFLGLMAALALVDIRVWFKLTYVLYAVTVAMLVYVDVAGHIGMGAQRWINLGVIKVQPSEIMKIVMVMTLARYFQGARADQLRNPFYLIPALMLVGIPVGLVMLQPDLGTAMMIVFVSVSIFFVAGVAIWMFVVAGAGALACLPVAWGLMHDYQRKRVLTFLNPEADPLGSGYHITQSKIALGSGGVTGKGYLNGTQSHLDFLPEKHTDFIFTLWAEEWGFMGSFGLMSVYALIVIYGFWMSTRVHHRFGRLLVLGVTVNFGFYALINIAMVMGLIPVVGVPLVMISYGGTAMMSVLIGFGIASAAYVYWDAKMPRG